MSAIMINNINVEFEVIKDEVFATSLQVAEVFEKRHDNILRTIESLPDDDFRRLNFQVSSEVRKNGVFDKETKYYKMTRDGFSLLVMGFTGEKAYRWKVEFIKAFNLLLDEVRALHTPKTLSEALFLAAKQAQEIEELSSSLTEAVRTKAWIGNKREATAMATASKAVREAEKLKIELDQSKDWASIKKVELMIGGKYSWHKLTKASEGLKIDRIDIFDSNYGTVKSYHKDVWLKAYNIDITKFELGA